MRLLISPEGTNFLPEKLKTEPFFALKRDKNKKIVKQFLFKKHTPLRFFRFKLNHKNNIIKIKF